MCGVADEDGEQDAAGAEEEDDDDEMDEELDHVTEEDNSRDSPPGGPLPATGKLQNQCHPLHPLFTHLSPFDPYFSSSISPF